MEFFKNVNVDWMAKKWYFLVFSLVVTVAGLVSMGVHAGSPAVWRGIPLGIDFKGGTIVTVKFNSDVHADHIRGALEKASVKADRVQSYDVPSKHQFIIALEQAATSESALESGRQKIVNALNAGNFPGGFEVLNVEVVGPQVGAQLRNQALWATLYSSIGMLVYLWYRFELIYGAAAVVAVLHDTLFTLGVFTLTNTELSLTVIAALLTLIGYSMNDTIVIFDRIRENLRTSRRESMYELVNRSINQTLSRTVLTSGLTFLTVAALYFFGGQVLHGFSFALVIGILIGTYSSIAVAAPMLVAYQTWRAEKAGRRGALADTGRRDKARA
jgi:preprotein translocase subunit SecF